MKKWKVSAPVPGEFARWRSCGDGSEPTWSDKRKWMNGEEVERKRTQPQSLRRGSLESHWMFEENF